MKTVLVFDTETNGATLVNGCLDLNRQQIVQLSWIIERGEEKVTKNYIISNATFINYAVPHAIEMSDVKRGIDFSIVIDEFQSDIIRADVVAAHNISFDRKVILDTMRRMNIPSRVMELNMMKKGFCTMYKHVDVCKILGSTGKNKRPKLSEVYHHYFGKYPEGKLHDALYDCEVTLVCYKEYKKNEFNV